VNFDELPDPRTEFYTDPEAIPGFNDEDAEVDQTAWDKPQSPQAGPATQDMTKISVSRKCTQVETLHEAHVNGCIVRMRLPSGNIEARGILHAAGLNGAQTKKHRKVLQKYRTNIRPGRSLEWWVPFDIGVYLCRALGLEEDLKELISSATLPLPPGDGYFLARKAKEGTCSPCARRGIECERTQARKRCDFCYKAHLKCEGPDPLFVHEGPMLLPPKPQDGGVGESAESDLGKRAKRSHRGVS
jgi:hypothetical protein